MVMLGVIRPGWDVEAGVNAWQVDGHHCFYMYSTWDHGCCYPGSNNWEGMQDATEQGDRIGMLLDLDQGSMAVWTNDEKRGVIVAEGLSGPLCWAVSMHGIPHEPYAARINAGLALASPTEEELAAAKAYAEAETDQY